jgi:hypothetical protein
MYAKAAGEGKKPAHVQAEAGIGVGNLHALNKQRGMQKP